MTNRFGYFLFCLAACVSATEVQAQSITPYPLPTPASAPVGIATGRDGALWFSEYLVGKIGHITISGAVTEFAIPGIGSVPTSQTYPLSIAEGSDGALWFAGGNAPGSASGPSDTSFIGRVTPSGNFTSFPTPTLNSKPFGIVSGPDGALWFTETNGSNIGFDNGSNIGRIAMNGAITEFPVPNVKGSVAAITSGPDGALWYTHPVTNGGDSIGRITTSGAFTEYPIPSGNSFPAGIATGSDGALWFTEFNAGKIGRITTSGTITEFPTPTPLSNPFEIAAGPDGALWFTENGANQLGRITTGGAITEFSLGTASSAPLGITIGPDGAFWITSGTIVAKPFLQAATGNIIRFTPFSAGASLVAAVLPSSRSVQIGNTATAFATMINAGTSSAAACGLSPVTTVPASFTYQTTNPATNTLTGSPNTPVNIPGNNGSQSFVIAFTASAPFVATDVDIGFACSNANAASSSSGLNTLLLSGSTSPVPDIVALAGTTTNDGVLRIAGNTGSAAFAVATVNLGVTAPITATADTGGATLPLILNLCQTNPVTGACTSAIGPIVSATINANTTPTFAIFASAGNAIPFAPATNRVFVRFKDSGGITRGSTSVAVLTQ